MGQFSKKTELIVSNDFLRPAMCRVYFKDGFLYATNAHLLIKQHLTLFGFTKNEVSLLNGHSISLEDFKMIRKFKEHYPLENGIECKTGNSSFLYLFNDQDFLDKDFPSKIDNIINQTLSIGQENDLTFGLNLRSLNSLREAMFLENQQAVFRVKHKNRGIIIFNDTHSLEKQIGLIMPINLSNN